MGVFPIGKEATTAIQPVLPELTDAWSGGWPQNDREFERLVAAYLGRLVLYASRRLGNAHDAEDVVQKVLVGAYSSRTERKGVSNVGAYLYRMASNCCTSHLRAHERTSISFDRPEAMQLPSSQPNPMDVAAASEELRRIESLLRHIPPEQAEVIRLRVLDELHLSEIAEVIGCPLATVKSRLRYGLEKLRQIVPQGEEASQ